MADPYAALEAAREAMAQIALAGMSGTGQECEDFMRAWHARRAWEFIGIAARALPQIDAALAARPAPMTREQADSLCRAAFLKWKYERDDIWTVGDCATFCITYSDGFRAGLEASRAAPAVPEADRIKAAAFDALVDEFRYGARLVEHRFPPHKYMFSGLMDAVDCPHAIPVYEWRLHSIGDSNFSSVLFAMGKARLAAAPTPGGEG